MIINFHARDRMRVDTRERDVKVFLDIRSIDFITNRYTGIRDKFEFLSRYIRFAHFS